MLADRRKTPRHVINRAAKVQAHVGAPSRECLVADMSDGGVRILAPNVEVPDEFILSIDGVEEIARKCVVVWRLDGEIGAEFIDAADSNFVGRVID